MRRYTVQNAIQIFVDVRIGRPIDAPAAFFEKARAFFIVLDLRFRRVGGTIDLDDQACCDTGEVRNVRTGRMLAAKPVTVQATAPEPGPEYGFRIGHFATQALCMVSGFSFAFAHAPLVAFPAIAGIARHSPRERGEKLANARLPLNKRLIDFSSPVYGQGNRI